MGYTENGERFLFDKEDFERIKDFCWRYDQQGYVVTNALVGGKRASLKLHRYVIGEIDGGMVVDHIVHSKDPRARKEDNRKSNLRVVTRAQNSQNQVPIRRTNTSGHRGVSWNKNGYWRSAISANGVRHMKYFSKDQFEEACEWYDKMAKELYGEYEYCDAEKGE